MKPDNVIRITDLPGSSRAAAWLLRRVCASSQGVGGRFVKRGFAKIREALVQITDPLVCVEINGTPLLVPLSHELPIYASRCPIYSQNIGRIARIITDASPGGASLIDIGANVGDTAAIVRSHCNIPYGTNGYGEGWGNRVAFTTLTSYAAWDGGFDDGYHSDQGSTVVLFVGGTIFLIR